MKACLFFLTYLFSCSLFAAETPQQPPEQQPVEAAATAGMTWRPSALADEGLTTTLEDQRGNWVLKREILRLARHVYEQVRAAALVVDTVKKDFLAARSATETQLAEFYTEIGYQEGEIDERIGELVKEIEQKKEQEASLSPEELKFVAELNEKKNELEQLKKDLKVLQELDASLNKAFAIALEQIELARSYEQHAWENYDKISEVLSDEIAERLYLEIQGFKSNVDSIIYYLNQELLAYLESTKKKIQEQMTSLKAKIADLKSRGILLEKNIEQFEAQKPKPAPAKVAVVPQTWYEKIVSTITWPFVYVYDAIKSIFQSIYSLFAPEQKKPAAVKEGKITPVEVAKTVSAPLQAGTLAVSAMPQAEAGQMMQPLQIPQPAESIPAVQGAMPVQMPTEQIMMPSAMAPAAPMLPTEVQPALPMPEAAPMLPPAPAENVPTNPEVVPAPAPVIGEPQAVIPPPALPEEAPAIVPAVPTQALQTPVAPPVEIPPVPTPAPEIASVAEVVPAVPAVTPAETPAAVVPGVTPA